MNQYGAVKVTVIGCVALAICGIGVPGLGSWGGRPLVAKRNHVLKAIVLAAAPERTTRVVPDSVVSAKVNAPPPYVRVASVKEHFLHSTPSNACVDPRMIVLSRCIRIGGTTGTPALTTVWANTGCSNVDVWIPESTMNMTQAPTIKDPNATVTLDITPPAKGNGGNCSVWVYHYGSPPAKPKSKAIPESSKRGLLVSLPSQE